MKPEDSNHDFPAKIGSPARRALLAAGYTQLDQRTTVSERDLLNLHGRGPKAIGILRQALYDRGLAFAADKKGLVRKELDR
jgi:hypothetical protein